MIPAVSAPSAARWDRVALGAIALGIVLRVVWILVIHPPLDYVYSDMQGYVERGMRLAAGGDQFGRYDAFFPPGTHILLALPFTIFGSDRTGLWGGAVLWCALSSLTPYFMWRLTRLLLTPAAAAVTALLCALYPLHIAFGGYFASETPAIGFLAGAIWLAYRAQRETGRAALVSGVVAGLMGGAAVANRPQLLISVGVAVVALLWGVRRNVRAAAAVTAGTLVVLGGVVVHNSLAADRLTGLAENGGLNFFIGHCDVKTVSTEDAKTGFTFEFTAPTAIQLERGKIARFQNRLVWDQGFFVDRGLDCIRHDGLGHTRILARSLFDMTLTTTPWPPVGVDKDREWARVSNVLYSAALPFIVFFALVLLRRRRAAGEWSGEAHLLAQLACAVFTALVFFGDPRFRAPYDLFGMALAGAVLAYWFLDEPRRWRVPAWLRRRLPGRRRRATRGAAPPEPAAGR